MSFLNVNAANQPQLMTMFESGIMSMTSISGQVIYLVNDGTNNIVSAVISGTVNTVITSGTIATSTSGQTAYLASGNNTVMLADVSGVGLVSRSVQSNTYLQTFPAQADVIKTIPWQIIPALSGGTALTTRAYDTVIVQAVPANSGNIHLGGSGSGPHTTRGYVLTPGSSVTLKTTDAANIYAMSIVSGDRIATIGYSFG